MCLMGKVEATKEQLSELQRKFGMVREAGNRARAEVGQMRAEKELASGRAGRIHEAQERTHALFEKIRGSPFHESPSRSPSGVSSQWPGPIPMLRSSICCSLHSRFVSRCRRA